jgi:membrane protease YdiL (CAAX protease family)
LTPTTPGGPLAIGLLLLVGAAGFLGWRAMAGRLRRLEPGDTAPQGVVLWLLGFLSFQLVIVWLVEPGPAPLARMLGLQTLAALLSAGLMLIVAALRHIPLESLGLRRHHGPSPLLLGLCAWFAFLPIFVGVGFANQAVQSAMGNETDMQRYLQLFLADDSARGSPLVWALMVVVLPLYEELLFRGALYGGLRRMFHPALAVVLGGLLFGVAHGEFSVALLPASALGMMLCVLYERTASLATPVMFHAAQNGLVLALLSIAPATGGAAP